MAINNNHMKDLKIITTSNIYRGAIYLSMNTEFDI
jgi:hypothetical protein